MLYETVLTTASPRAKREGAKNRVREIRLQVTHQFLDAFEFSFAMRAHMTFLITGRFSLDGRDYIGRNVEGVVSLHWESLRWC
jgi:hypothetical protein